MKQTKSFNPKPGTGIVRAMRPLSVGIPASAALSAALAIAFAMALDGCSSGKNNKTTVSSPAHTASLTSGSGTETVSAIPPAPATPAVTPKKKTLAQRLSTVGYADPTYGVSFRYPRTYTLMTPEKTKLEQSVGDIPMNFVQPGGVELATISLPGGAATAFFKVSVNKNLSAGECDQFADPDSSDAANNSPVDTTDESIPSKVTLRGVEFSRVENGTEQSDLRYYHHFQNGACYEFVMGVQDLPGSKKPVDHFAQFDKLERVLATVKIKEDAASAVTADVPAAPATPLIVKK